MNFNLLFVGINLYPLLPSPFSKLFSQFWLAKSFGGANAELAIFATYISCIILSQTETFEMEYFKDELKNLDDYIYAYIASNMADQDMINYFITRINNFLE